MKIAIIGAGCSGITAIKSLKDKGITDLVCFEQNDRVGGNWIYSSSPSHSSIMDTTHIISSKALSQYSDFPMPAEYPDYPSHAQVLDYFENYSNHFDLKKFIRFNTKVDRITLDEDQKWNIYTDQDPNPEKFDYLLLSSGHHSVPRHAPVVEGFSGQYFHAHDFKSKSLVKDKRVLVIGGGNSACDCAVESSRVANRVVISMRRPHYIIPKFMMGKPTDVFNDTLKFVPRFLHNVVSKIGLKIQIGRYEDYGLVTPPFSITKDHPTINSELLYMLRHGRVIPKRGIQSIDGKKVEFEDGTNEEFDVIIGATGYKIATPFFDSNILDYSEADEVPLYLRMFHPKYKNLIFIGLVQPQGAVWPLSEAQSMLAANYINGKWKTPENMVKIADDEAKNISKEFLKRKRHTIEVHFKPYLKKLQEELSKSTL